MFWKCKNSLRYKCLGCDILVCNEFQYGFCLDCIAIHRNCIRARLRMDPNSLIHPSIKPYKWCLCETKVTIDMYHVCSEGKDWLDVMANIK